MAATPAHDRDRDGEHVVDEQRAGRRQAGRAAEVDAGDGVGTAPVRKGPAGLPIGRDDHHQQDRDHHRHVPGEVEGGQATQAQDEQDLLGGVRDRGQRVAAEHRHRQPLGQQGLRELAAAQR
jgi:hypothetical protein